ncbi:hypothetical protein HHX48_01565 [Salinimonas sp. HHU 13199]|uniref:Sulfurtransferase complex subunit TusB n=1 Tax=Salinimonas profundi TaxID=2729140 RepID=A0ABR8LH51_9ALTE|nr:hypothetical protein [Salinimonas profundi]MBD3584421.1 hypothetical protein [Salinimonas profundi]
MLISISKSSLSDSRISILRSISNVSAVLTGDGIYLAHRLSSLGIDVMVYQPDAQTRGVDTSVFKTLSTASLVSLSAENKTWVSW